ncbi:MFS transporter [Xanthomonas campestris pv. asclepiadis]|uniref:MFS transporter n=1 Tax=Xanthomonas campestris TaxID=339 RepID=UPI001E61F22A|nr:MFS transporter [Xanthomonas campestris]MCC4614912.1 MFS transporter [Xanthomonas campestris pv. asclepiadis]
MPSHLTAPLPLILPPAALRAYVAAHFGKSLLWYTGELLLIFALTEYVGLSAVAAGASVAGGLVVSAGMGMFAARRWSAGVSLAWAGRSQWRGIRLAAVALALVFVTPALPAGVRLISVLLLSLPFHAAYAVGDIAQNTLLGLGHWPWRGARGVSALRLIGSGLAALVVSAAIGLVLKAGTHAAASTALMVVVLVSSIALLSAWWLRNTLQPYAHAAVAAPSLLAGSNWKRDQLLPVAVIAALALALPTFTKLAPYLAQSRIGSAGWGSAVLIAYALGSVFIQPLAARWPTMAMRRLGLSGAALSGLGLIFALATSRHSVLDAGLAFGMGLAAGSAGQWVWARHAELSSRHGPAQQARESAALTATAQLALAAGSGLIGLLLGASDYHHGHDAHLAWAMALGPMLCGVSCVLIAWIGSAFAMHKKRRPVAAALPSRQT